MIFAAPSTVMGEGGSKAVESGRAAKCQDRLGSIRPALPRLESGIAHSERANCGRFDQPFNLVARRSGQLAKAKADFCRPANDMHAGQKFTVTLNSPALRIAGNDNAPLKIEPKKERASPRPYLRPINSGIAEASPVNALHGKSRDWRERVEPKLYANGAQLDGAGEFPHLMLSGFQEQHEEALLPSMQGPDSDAQPNPATASSKYRAGLALLVVMSFLLGAAGVAFGPAAWSKITALTAYHFRGGGNLTDIGWTSDPLALPRMNRDNRLFSYLDLAINRATKQPYVEDVSQASRPASEADAPVESDSLAAEPGSEDQLTPDSDTLTAGPETPVEGGVRSLPSLYFDPATGKQVIGNFATRSFPGDHGACTEIAQAMLHDARAKQEALYTLADTQAIKVMRFCAANGSVITTCRNGRITISPRRPRPNDGCSGRGTL